MPRRDSLTECPCCHSASQERQAMEAHEQRGHRPAPSREGVKIPGPYPMAAMEWLSPPTPRRDQDALCETTGPEPSSHTFCECVAGRGMARDFARQVAEIQIHIAVPNRYTALGIPVTEPVGLVRPGKGEERPSPDLCNKAVSTNKSSHDRAVKDTRHLGGRRSQPHF